MKNSATQPKAALITGAAKRIGRTIALALSAMGYDIALHCRSSLAEARQVQEQIRRQNTRCEIFQCDLGDENAVSGLIGRVRQTFPHLRLLVNNASIYSASGLKTSDLDIFKEHFAVNLKAPFILISEFADKCRAGHIINVLDANIRNFKTAYVSYFLFKRTLADLTSFAAAQLAPAIRVNGIAPGIILPPAQKGVDYLDGLIREVPLQRKGDLEDIARVVEFLDKNDYLTGQIIFVDGGLHLK